MAYCVLISGLFALAAVFGERALVELGWPRRGVWLAALAASIGLPVMAWLVPSSAGESSSALPFAFDLLPAMPGTDVARGAAAGQGAAGPVGFDWLGLDRALETLWIASSAAMLIVCLVAAFRLRRALRRAPIVAIDGREVALSDRLGPAVTGFFRPTIVLPRWLAEEQTRLRSLVLAHEHEHVAARDPLVLLAALLLVAAMPWNPLLWWQLMRLRAAIEVDCDARVLRGGVDRRRYSEALLAVRERSAAVPLGAVALTEPASQLEQRVRIMLEQARQLSVSRLGWRLVLVLSLVTVACAVEAPLAQQADGDEAVAVATIRTAVYERLLEAQQCLDVDDLDCAHAVLDATLEMNLNGYEAAQYWNFNAFLAFDEGDVDGAIDAYENALAQQPIPDGFRESILRNLGTLYAQNDRYREAFEILNTLLELRGVSAMPAGPRIGITDGEYLPIAHVAPQYPEAAAARGLQGFVVVSYTVTATGTTADAVVVESSDPIFEQAALDAATKYKYKPRVVDGRPVAAPGVTTRINFEIEAQP